MDKENNRVVLVTGASSGIGLACATHLAGRGYRVYGTSRRAATGQAGSVAMLVADVTDDHSVERAVAAVLEREGRLDIVVNNAGIGIAGPVENTPIEAAKRQLEVNFFGAFRVCRAVLPAMRSHGGGYIVNIGSIGGLIAIPYQAMYSASKFALEGLSESLRMEVRPFGVKVVIIEPGDHKTALTGNRTEMSGGTDAYSQSFQAALARTAHDEQNGPGPEQVARLLYSDSEYPQSATALHHRTRHPARCRVAKTVLALQHHRVQHAHLLRVGQVASGVRAKNERGCTNFPRVTAPMLCIRARL
jgi:NAD(P)-dependent dehydrogenase (short-subunit alcohol dehydrogenase family)